MSRTCLVLLVLAAALAPSVAQPVEGDLLLSFLNRPGGTIAGGFTGYVRPSTSSAFTTLVAAPATYWHNWVRMAPNNSDLVVAECNGRVWQGYLLNCSSGGQRTTISPSLPLQMDGFELDHDNRWIVCGKNSAFQYLYGIPHGNGAVQTYVALAGFAPGTFNEVAIDRERTGPLYAIAVHDSRSGTLAPRILWANRRNGVFATLRWIGNPCRFSGIELHARTGNYVTTGFDPVGLNLVPKGGTPVTSLFVHVGANAVKIDGQDRAWVVGWLGSIPAVLCYDLTNNAFIRYAQITGTPASAGAMCVELYGSRSLVCHQTSPANVSIRVQSRRSGAGGLTYALAASFSRRPPPGPHKNLRFPNGEYLFLDHTDPLFLLTAQNLVPGIFSGFRGKLSAAGNASATVAIPVPGPGISIFVAGVILGPSGVFQATNTHWFVW